MNFKKFLVKTAVLFALIIGSRALFQFPVEYFGLVMLKQTAENTVFSKIDALKVLSLVAIFFALYFRQKLARVHHPRLNIKESIFYIIIAELLIVAYYLTRSLTNLYDVCPPVLYLIWAGIIISLAASFLCFTTGVYGREYVETVFRKFREELIIAGVASVLLYILLILFQKQWLFFSTLVSRALNSMLSLNYDVIYAVNNYPVIHINNFAISIGPPCSGIDSMLLFAAFFAGIYALDNRKIPLMIAIPAFILGFIGIIAVNILRLYLLIVIGVEVSPQLAVGMFHTQAGWVLFLLYFLTFYWAMKRVVYR